MRKIYRDRSHWPEQNHADLKFFIDNESPNFGWPFMAKLIKCGNISLIGTPVKKEPENMRLKIYEKIKQKKTRR